MPDREKVIAWLNEIVNTLDSFTDDSEQEVCQLAKDTLALLKEQEAKMQGADSGMCEICSFYERALPVKPHYNARTNWYECGACHYSMTSGMHCRSELIPATKVRYCANCGFPVNWEGR